jgi:hypothetical protein
MEVANTRLTPATFVRTCFAARWICEVISEQSTKATGASPPPLSAQRPCGVLPVLSEEPADA